MHFTQSLTSIFVTGLLATSAIAGVIDPVARSDSNDVISRDGLQARKLSKDALHNWGKKTCSSKKKRAIVARADVGLNEAKGAGPTETLTTGGLSTCMGLVVTGTRKHGKTPDNHFMAHVVMDGSRDAVNKLKTIVNKAKPDLDSLKSYYTQAALTQANTKKLMEEFESNISDEDAKEYMEYLNEEYKETVTVLTSLAAVAGKTTHDPLGSNSMSSDGNGKVLVNGKQI